MHGRQVDIKKKCVGHVDFLRDVGRALLYARDLCTIMYRSNQTSHILFMLLQTS